VRPDRLLQLVDAGEGPGRLLRQLSVVDQYFPGGLDLRVFDGCCSSSCCTAVAGSRPSTVQAGKLLQLG
jgi:hypothetical protein